MPDQNRIAAKRAAAISAVEEVEDGMIVGLGTGSTAALAIEALAVRVARGLRIAGIPTSETSAALAREMNVPLTSFAQHRHIDLTIDGADQVARGTLDLIKGLGGALLREKIVASASRRMIVIVDETKMVDCLGDLTKLPIEIVQFGYETVIERLTSIGCAPQLRMAENGPFITDGGNYIADCAVGLIHDAARMQAKLAGIVGVVESGLFVGLASKIIVGTDRGVEVFER